MKTLKMLALSSILAILISPPALANESVSRAANTNSIKTLQVSTPNDLEMSCNALSVEAANMSQIIQTTQTIKDQSQMKSHGVTAAGAVGSFLIGSVTGGIGLAVGGFLMNHNIEERGDQADEIQDFAAQRRTLMTGIHNAKGCFGPIEHVMQNPEKFDPISKIALANEEKYHAELRKRYND